MSLGQAAREQEEGGGGGCGGPGESKQDREGTAAARAELGEAGRFHVAHVRIEANRKRSEAKRSSHVFDRLAQPRQNGS